MLRLIFLRLLESYFRHRWLYLLPIVVMIGAASVYALYMAPTYTVNGTLYVQNGTLLSSLTDIRADGFSYVTPAQATSGELHQLLNSHAFLRAIIQQTDMESKMGQGEVIAAETIDEAKEAISLQELGDNLVMITASHEMPRIAHQLADSTIETYIQWKINLNREESVAAQTFFADLIKTYSAEVEPARQALNGYLITRPRPIQGDRPEEETSEIKRLQAALDTAEERLSRAENQEESARLALTQAESTVRQTYFVVDQPTRPLTAARSKKELLLAFALFVFAGAFISGVGIVGGALLDDSLRFPIDVVHGLHLPVLAMAPEAKIQILHLQRRTREIADTSQQAMARNVDWSYRQDQVITPRIGAKPLESERLDRVRMDQERIDRERIDRERIDRELAERMERERMDWDRMDRERIERAWADQAIMDREIAERNSFKVTPLTSPVTGQRTPVAPETRRRKSIFG